MVIAGDDWTTIMYRTMEATNEFSAVFFVALIVLGQVLKRKHKRTYTRSFVFLFFLRSTASSAGNPWAENREHYVVHISNICQRF